MSKSKAAVISRASGTQIGNEVPLVGVCRGIAVFFDGSLAMGVDCHVPTPDYISEDEQVRRHKQIRTLLNSIAKQEKYGIQIVYRQNGRFTEIGNAMKADASTPPAVREFLDETAALYSNRMEAGVLRMNRLQIFITRKPVASAAVIQKRARKHLVDAIVNEPPTHSTENPVGRLLNSLDSSVFRRIRSVVEPAFFLGAPVGHVTEEEFMSGEADLRAAIESVVLTVRSLGGTPTLLDDDGWIRTYFEHWNKGAFTLGASSRPYDPASAIDVADYFCVSPFDWDPTGRIFPHPVFVTDGTFHCVLSLRHPPSPISPHHLLGLCCYNGLNTMDVIVNIRPSSREQRVKALTKHAGHLEGLKPPENHEAAIAQLKQEVKDLEGTEEQVFEAQHLIHVWAPTIEQLESHVRTIKHVSMVASAMEFIEEADGLWEYWLCTQPGYVDYKDKYRVNFYNSWQITGLLPFFAVATGLEGEGDAPGAVFETLQGTLANIQIKHRQLSNGNGMILGAPGKGKSVLLNQILFQYARYNPKTIIIDIGDSYSGYCETVGGSFIRFSLDSTDYRINPFDIFIGKKLVDPEDADFILGFLATLMFPHAEDHPTEVDERVMSEALNVMVRSRDGRAFYLTDYREQISTMEGLVGKRLADRLYKWCNPNGQWRNLFDGPTSLSLTKDTIVFELKAFEDQPEVLAVLFTVIFTQIAAISHVDGRVKILAIDEAAILMRIPRVYAFVEKAYRTFRKLEIDTWGLSQTFEEWLGPSGKNHGITNAVTHLCVFELGQKALAPIISTYGFSATEAEAMASVQSEKGVFSQAFYARFGPTRVSTTLMVTLSPLGYAMSTTDPLDRDAIRRLRADNDLSLGDALREFSRIYPRGVARAPRIKTNTNSQ